MVKKTEKTKQMEISKIILRKLNYIFGDLFDYLKNEDYKMENDTYNFLKQLKETFDNRNQFNEDQIDAYDELIEKMRRDLSGILYKVSRTRNCDVPADFFKDMFDEYKNIYSLI